MFNKQRPNIAPITDSVWEKAKEDASRDAEDNSVLANLQFVEAYVLLDDACTSDTAKWQLRQRVRTPDVHSIMEKVKAIGTGTILYTIPGRTYKVHFKNGKITGVK